MTNLPDLFLNRGGSPPDLGPSEGSRGLERPPGIDSSSSQPRQPPYVRQYENKLARQLGGLRLCRAGDPLELNFGGRYSIGNQSPGSRPVAPLSLERTIRDPMLRMTRRRQAYRDLDDLL
jgi:hypothetical protein